jgi:hypothetical protein
MFRKNTNIGHLNSQNNASFARMRAEQFLMGFDVSPLLVRTIAGRG